MENLNKLYSRSDFRNNCLKRDNFSCVICKSTKNIVVHHIIERRLFNDGGYYLNNGASLCEHHHIEAEKTTLSVEEIRKACGITEKVIPSHFYEDVDYDKWGNQVLKNGQRLKGELFNDESVQKILRAGDVLNLFTNRVKYPRTYHLPWSAGMNRNDRQMTDVSIFDGEQVVITEKMDGENCLDQNSILITDRGPKTIKWICDNKYNGKVLSYNIASSQQEFKTITNWQILDNTDDWYEIELLTGQKIILTSEHEVWLPKLKVWKKVKDLQGHEEMLLKK